MASNRTIKYYFEQFAMVPRIYEFEFLKLAKKHRTGKTAASYRAYATFESKGFSTSREIFSGRKMQKQDDPLKLSLAAQDSSKQWASLGTHGYSRSRVYDTREISRLLLRELLRMKFSRNHGTSKVGKQSKQRLDNLTAYPDSSTLVLMPQMTLR